MTVGANIEGGVLGEKCLMESIGIGSRYYQRNRFGGPREHRYAPFEGVVSFFVWEFNFITDLLRNGERYKNFDLDMNCSIQWALQENAIFAVVGVTVQVLTGLDVLVHPLATVYSPGKTPMVNRSRYP